MTHPLRVYAVILLGVCLWCAAIVAAPILSVSTGSPALYDFFRPICHQLDGRSFHIDGHSFAVCARCSSIYFGFLGGVVLFPLFGSVRRSTTPPRWLLIAAGIPMLLDVTGALLGIHEASLLTRAVTGLVFGSILPSFVLPGAIEGLVQGYSSLRRSTINQLHQGHHHV